MRDFLIEKAAGEALKKKAEKSGIPVGILRQVYNRGMAAWKTGHRPGATQQQWGYARVNSFITKGKGTWGKADADLAAKARASKKESVEIKQEKLGPDADAGDYIKDFRKSKAPQFKGKSDVKKQKMAIAAFLANRDKKEEVQEASKEGTIRIIDLGRMGKGKGFQVQRMTKGKFVNQGKPYKSQKDAEKVRKDGQHSMQFEAKKAPKVDPDKYAKHMAKNDKKKKLSSTQRSLADIRKRSESLEEAVKYNFAVVDANDFDKVIGFASDLSDAKDIARKHTKNGISNGKIIKLKKPMSAKKGDMMVNRRIKKEEIDEATKYGVIRYPDTAISYVKNDGKGWEHIYDKSYGFKGKVDKKDLKHMSPIEMEKMPKRMREDTRLPDEGTDEAAKRARSMTPGEMNEDADNFKSMSARIKKAKTVKDLDKLDKSIDRVYNVGALTAGELKRLDGMIMDRKTKMESKQMKSFKSIRENVNKKKELDEKKQLHLFDNKPDAEKKAKEIGGKVVTGKGKSMGKFAAVKEAKNYEYKNGKVHISRKNFAKVHKDYKNTSKGKERMSVLDPKTQGTVSAPVVFTEGFSKSQLASLKKAYEPLRGKRISLDNANKLRKMLDKVKDDKAAMSAIWAADIPFVSTLAMNHLLMVHNMKPADIKKLKESVLQEAEGNVIIKPSANADKETSNIQSLAKKLGLKVTRVAKRKDGGFAVHISGNMKKLYDLQSAASNKGMKVS